ncbi:hypothetical protein AK830_g1991 [Neonectria ditissima]|uniref:Zn(2)-C6 fungal-type domain-containing protein n=1 Tax=Neonectria ditissima TaxID=78410 RepID=A0A0P7B4I4_9HYPO|nr:hypothetical protein AK830_g1991 [Neonectria ditissima]
MSEPAAKRRKVRKGTRSCWECRRRKIKCEFGSDEDAVCVGCVARDSRCVSQEEAVEPAPTPPDRRLAQRLGRLEELMEKIVNNTTASAEDPAPPPKMPTPSESPATGPSYGSGAGGSGNGDGLGDIFDSTAGRMTSLGPGSAPVGSNHLPSPLSAPLPFPSRGTARAAKYHSISRTLHGLLPAQQTLYAISQQSPGAKYVLAAFYSQQDQLDGKPAPISALAQVPRPTSHPALLAKRLLQLAICLQQMPPFFDGSGLGLAKPPGETMEEWVAAAGRLVTSDDDLVGCLEGLECLVLQSFYQSDAGHLRKSWMTSRRALNMAQLMGIDRKATRTIRSCDPEFDVARQPSPAVLWFRINCSDRYLSLILGLPVGSRDDSAMTAADDDPDNPEPPSDKLGKVYSVIAGKISDRNNLAGAEAYAMTQELDMELEKAAKLMTDLWWKPPDMAMCCASSDHCVDDMSASKIQVRHFSLLILLHLPYLLQDPGQRRYEYNRVMCMQASRDVLVRFLEYRGTFTQAISGRHVDYSALIAAMSLLLGYLGPPLPGHDALRAQDRAMTETVQQKMHDMGALNNDRLCLESAETIRQLLPIVQGSSSSPGSREERTVHLNIPFLGTVNIHPPPTPPPSTLLPSTGSTPATHAADAAIMSGAPSSLPAFENTSVHCPYISMDGDVHSACPGETADFTQWPCFTADLEDWALQGVDTTYWSMLNSSIT